MHTRCLEGMGSVVFVEDVSVGLAWVGFAAVVGFALTAAAASFFRGLVDRYSQDSHELDLGYNALAAVVDSPS
jgi:galactitol-specific phosphotransferase system IIC component